MAVMDEFKEERQTIKDKTFKEKCAYYWEYYGWRTIGTIAVVIALISIFKGIFTSKDNALYAVYINTYPVEEQSAQEYNDKYFETLNLSPKKYEVSIDTSMYMTVGTMEEGTYGTTQKTVVLMAAGDVDLLGGDAGAFQYYAYFGYLTDLRDFLSEEQIEAYSPYFYYIDQTVLDTKMEMADNFEEYTGTYPDPFKPEEMDDPVPVGLCLDYATAEYKHNYLVSDGAIGITVNCPRPENALAYLDYIFRGLEE